MRALHFLALAVFVIFNIAVFALALLGRITVAGFLFVLTTTLGLFAFFPRLAFRGAAAFAMALAVTTPAFAAAAAVEGSTLFNIPPAAWTEINELLVGIFLALGAMIWKWLDAHSPLKNTQAEQIARDAFQGLLDKAATYGLSQASAEEKKVGSIDVGNASVAAAANFAIAHAPDLAKSLGVDVSTPEGQAAIIRSVTLRIASLTGTAAGMVTKTTADGGTLTIPQEAKPAEIALPASVSLVGAQKA